MSDISLYYGLNPYYENEFTNANGKIRNLVWEELVHPVGGNLSIVNSLVFLFMQKVYKMFRILHYCYLKSRRELSLGWPIHHWRLGR